MNWKKKFENKAFWVAIIPATLLLIQAILGAFGVSWDYTAVSEKLLAIVNALFVVLAILGIVVDPNTEGVLDAPKDTYTEEELGEEYNALNEEDTGEPNHATPEIEGEVLDEVDDGGLIGNKLP